MLTKEDLRKIKTFKDCTDAELTEIAPFFGKRSLESGKEIMASNEEAPGMMFILEGSVEIINSSDSNEELVLATLEHGDFFGELSLLSDSTRIASVRTKEKCEVLVLLKDDFMELVKNHSAFSLSLMRSLADRILYANLKLAQKNN